MKKLNRFLPTKKVYKSKLNYIFVFIFTVGTLIVEDPQMIELMPKEYIGYITTIIGFIGVIIRTFYTDTKIEI